VAASIDGPPNNSSSDRGAVSSLRQGANRSSLDVMFREEYRDGESICPTKI
jgi:hypothetical protein